MIPIDQTNFSPTAGNCFTACIASILEIDLDEIPNFCALWPNEGRWFDELNKWLRPRGLFALMFTVDRPEQPCEWFRDAFVIMSGPGPRGCNHAVVWQNDKMLHDPHPNRTGLTKLNDVIFFGAIDPAAHTVRASNAAATHYVLATNGGRYVKEAEFFRAQGGLVEPWGRAWQPVIADSIEQAREVVKPKPRLAGAVIEGLAILNGHSEESSKMLRDQHNSGYDMQRWVEHETRTREE